MRRYLPAIQPTTWALILALAIGSPFALLAQAILPSAFALAFSIVLGVVLGARSYDLYAALQPILRLPIRVEPKE
jgi:hypothetical protein